MLYVSNAKKPCLLDNASVDGEDIGKDVEKYQLVARAIVKKKKHVITTTIKAFNDQHEVLLDVFSCRLASKC